MNDEDIPEWPKHSKSYKMYFESLDREVKRIYEVAEVARAKGYDPSTKVEIPPAHDVAARVEATLDGPVGVAKRIRELQVDMGREEVAFAVAREIALGELGGIKDPEKAADKAVRVALAILTESITAAPLEGISKVRIRGSEDSQYLAIYLAGPIRAAGGTEAAVTVLVADYVRQVLKLPPFKATEDEVERALEEVELYARNVHLQYNVYPDMIRFASQNLPIMLNGEPTEEFEVSANRDLSRIETNRVRSGSVLVLNDGVVGRAAKLSKIVHRVDIDGWEWLDKISEKISKAKSSKDKESDNKLAPKPDYLADVIGGRPVFSHPSRIGGFRLRYGRSRNTGLAGVGVHPATMVLVEEFLAPGTHIRTERPGKGSIVAPVDTIEGPIVLLEDGTVKQIHTFKEAMEVQGKVTRIIALGDILVALGEFLENNHPLAPSGYCEEWWSHDLDKICAKIERDTLEKKLEKIHVTPEELNAFIETPLTRIPSAIEAIHLSKKLKVPLHPRYTYRWKAANLEEVKALREHVLAKHSVLEQDDGTHLEIPVNKTIKAILEKIGIPHTPKKGKKVLLLDLADVMLIQLGSESKEGKGKDALSFMNSVSDVELKDRVGFSIGARMGRPEKAQVRRMRPPVQVLFPVGRAMGTERNVAKVARGAAQKSDQGTLVTDESVVNGVVPAPSFQLEIELVTRRCPRCQNQTFESRCPVCGGHTEVRYWCSHEDCGLDIDEGTGMCPRRHDVNLIRGTRYVPIDMEGLLKRIREEIDEPESYELRGVLGLTSDLKIPEYLGKGILRAKHGVYCYRDGTARFDATDAPLTHFTPVEVGVPFHRLRELGYLTDIEGEPLHSDDQILELKVQDVVVPENYGEYMVQIGDFVDDCLEKIYGVDRYYNFKHPDDVVGQLVIGLAPHTSAGIIGRVIGFTSTSVCLAHPYWHAAKRRNCIVGKEEVLLLDEEDRLIVKPISSLDGEDSSHYRVLSVEENGDLQPRKIQGFVKLPAPKTLYKIRTSTGRDITVTADHKMVRLNGDRTEYVETRDLRVGDRLLALSELPRSQTQVDLDVLNYFSNSDTISAMRVHNVKDFLRQKIQANGGYVSVVRQNGLGISAKSLWGRIDKDSIPLDLYLQLTKALNLQSPSSATISYRKTVGNLPFRIPLTNELGELVGLYLSNGYSRTDRVSEKTKYFYQVVWESSEKEVADRIVSYCSKIFNRLPSVEVREDGMNIIALSGRIFYDLFRDILGLGASAKEKKADKCINYPLAFKQGLLGGFIQGDGHVSTSIKVTSENRRLLNHLALISLGLGLFPHLSNSTRTTSFAQDPATFYSLRFYSSDIETLEPLLFASRLEQLEVTTNPETCRGKCQEGFGKFNVVKIKEIQALDDHDEEYVYDFVIEGGNKTFLGGFGTLATYDCDGDEDALILVLDALLNFSRAYLPKGRGGFMDAPLVLSVILNPSEVDDESHNMEICTRYPAKFYEIVAKAQHPRVVEPFVDILASRLDTEAQYEGFGFTHGTTSVNVGPRNTRYKTLGSMAEKLDAQLKIATLVDAVDTADVAQRVLSHHFLRDIRGNLRAYSTQKIRCIKCNRIYRRIPISGKCVKCGDDGKLSLTVRERNISKYLEIAQKMIDDHGLGVYLQQRLQLINTSLDSLFVSEQTMLTDFFE